MVILRYAADRCLQQVARISVITYCHLLQHHRMLLQFDTTRPH